jgi:hypothetical protein
VFIQIRRSVYFKLGFLRDAMSHESVFPDPPSFTDAEVDECRRSSDYCPILFEWYKYVGVIANLVACIELSSPGARVVAKSHFGALIGLLNRCSRLMLSNVALSHEGLYGETTALVDRCIFESAVQIQWLCKQDSHESFGRYLAEGLKTELALKSEIEDRISSRGGKRLPIEQRMLESISKYLETSGMTDGQIAASKKLPDLASMLDTLGRDHLAYVVGQKIGSHHVHGTWPSLLTHYLDWDASGNFCPRDHNAPTHVNQYVFIPLMVLGAAKSYCTWLMNDPEATLLVDMLQAIEDEILAINREVIGGDFTFVEET